MTNLNTDEIRKYYVVDGMDEKDVSDDYQILRGPGEFECVITEPEDRTFGRDLSSIVDKLNEQQDEIDRLRDMENNLRAEILGYKMNSEAMDQVKAEVEQRTRDAAWENIRPIVATLAGGLLSADEWMAKAKQAIESARVE